MDKMNERQAYNEYVKACHSKIGEFVSEYNFEEWRLMGRPKSPYKYEAWQNSI